MELAPYQIALLVYQLLVLPLIGGWVLLRLLGTDQRRISLLATNRLTYWPVSFFEFALALLLVLFTGAICQAALLKLAGPSIKDSPDRAGLEIVFGGLGFHGFALLAWPIFYGIRRRLYRDYQAEVPAMDRAPRLSAGKLFWNGLGTLLISLPVVMAVSLVWNPVLRAVGFSDEQQNLIAIFGGARSPVVLGAMLTMACVVAPINEELLFRGAVYRFCRQKLGRSAGILISATLFGAFHLNLASFLPLAALGAIFAIAYETTGDIRVPMVAHGLFNLNTIVLILCGLANQT